MCDVISLLAMVPMNDRQPLNPFQERPCDNQNYINFGIILLPPPTPTPKKIFCVNIFCLNRSMTRVELHAVVLSDPVYMSAVNLCGSLHK